LDSSFTFYDAKISNKGFFEISTLQELKGLKGIKMEKIDKK